MEDNKIQEEECNECLGLGYVYEDWEELEEDMVSCDNCGSTGIIETNIN